MKEIGSFIDLELPKGREWFKGDHNLARLNSGRAAIWHAIRLTGAKTIWLPYYQCQSVRDFLSKKGCRIRYYHQDACFTPIDLQPDADDAVLLVNYFGIMSASRMQQLASLYKNVIIDYCQAFFCQPVPGTFSVYSARKFVGSPDGAYVCGENAQQGVSEYPMGHSSDTAAFLLMRMEYGCEGKAYEAREKNEARLDAEDVTRMSVLTHSLLDAADYEYQIRKRKENFQLAHKLFGDVNLISPLRYVDGDTVPMVYPLVVENEALLTHLLRAKHFQGRWWAYLTREMPEDTFEHWLSRYMIPITIDQRYGDDDLRYIHQIVCQSLKKEELCTE